MPINTLEKNIVRKHTAFAMVDEDAGAVLETASGTGTLYTSNVGIYESAMRRRTTLKI